MRESLIWRLPHFLILAHSSLGTQSDQLESYEAPNAEAKDGNECSESDHDGEEMAKDCESECVGQQSPGKAYNCNDLVELLLVPFFWDIGGR